MPPTARILQTDSSQGGGPKLARAQADVASLGMSGDSQKNLSAVLTSGVVQGVFSHARTAF